MTEVTGININLHKHADRKVRLTYSKCIHQYAAPFIASCRKLEHSPCFLTIWDPSNRTSPEPHGIFCEGTRLVSEQILHLVQGNIRSQQRLYHSKYDKQLFQDELVKFTNFQETIYDDRVHSHRGQMELKMNLLTDTQCKFKLSIYQQEQRSYISKVSAPFNLQQQHVTLIPGICFVGQLHCYVFSMICI